MEEKGMEELSAIPVWLCIPFAGLLLSIAVMPLIKPDWWEKHQPLAVAFWSVLFIVPFAAKYGMFTMGETVLECVVNDYLTFIILLFGLFCVAGNITIDGEFAGSPRINTALFVLGTLLSSVIGTTGSSMLLVRPFIKMNSWRKRKSHIMIFFIFLISNMGGCLTPIGDPPLLMGFMRGVPFFWSLKLFHILIFNMIILLTLFYFLDRRAYRKDIAEGRKPDIREPGTHVRIVGLHNLIYVAMIVGAVILSGMLPGMSAFQNADGTVKGIHILGEVTLGFPSVIEIVIIRIEAVSQDMQTRAVFHLRCQLDAGNHLDTVLPARGCSLFHTARAVMVCYRDRPAACFGCGLYDLFLLLICERGCFSCCSKHQHRISLLLYVPVYQLSQPFMIDFPFFIKRCYESCDRSSYHCYLLIICQLGAGFVQSCRSWHAGCFMQDSPPENLRPYMFTASAHIICMVYRRS